MTPTPSPPGFAGIRVVCRDRGSAYAEGARQGAPQAIQVADRWHLLHNLTSAVDRVVRSHRKCLRQPAEPASATRPVAPGPPLERISQTSQVREQNTRGRHAEIHTLLGDGVGITRIIQMLNLDRKTVRRYARAAEPEQLLTEVGRRGSDFAGMTRHRQGRHLDTWIAQATSSGIPAIAGFADGLLEDYDAVRNGLTLEHSSGAVEGHVNRIKMIKRTMYGRANFDLLRRRVLLADRLRRLPNVRQSNTSHSIC